MCTKSLQSFLTLCYPMDCSQPGSSVLGILQQEHWSGLPCPPPGDLPNSGIQPVSLMFPALAGRFFTTSTPGKPPGQVSWPPVTAAAYVFTKAALRVFCSPELPSKLLL